MEDGGSEEAALRLAREIAQVPECCGLLRPLWHPAAVPAVLGENARADRWRWGADTRTASNLLLQAPSRNSCTIHQRKGAALTAPSCATLPCLLLQAGPIALRLAKKAVAHGSEVG